MVYAAEADVVCPAIAAENPNGFLGEVFFVIQNILTCRAIAVKCLKCFYQSLGCRGILCTVGNGIQICLASRFHVFRCFISCRNLLHIVNQTVTDCVLTEVHTEAMLCVILEQGVCPCGTVTVFIDSVGGCCRRTAPNGRTACSIGDIHSVTEQLGDQTCIRGFCTACAGARELEKRGLELAADYSIICKVFLDGDVGNHIIECRLFCILRLTGYHFQRGGRADADTYAATHTIHRRNRHGVFINILALTLFVHDGGYFGCGSCFFSSQRIRTDGCVRADIGTLVALYASIPVPLGNHNRNAAFFISRRALLEGTVCMVNECGNRQAVTVHFADGLHDVVNHLDQLCGTVLGHSSCIVGCICPICGNINLHIRGCACVDCFFVHLDDFNTLLHELLGFFFHIADSFRLGKNLRQGEESGLKNGIGTFAQADLCGKVNRVHGVKLNIVFGNVTLGFCVELFSKFCRIPLAVDEEYAAGLNILHHLEALFNIRRVVACHEVRFIDVIGALNRLVAETKVGNGYAAGFLGVILEICLNIFVGMVADDFDGVFVCTDGTVAAQAPEFALDGAFRSGIRRGLLVKREMCNIVLDADGELTLGVLFVEMLIHCKHTCRGSVLRTETVSSAANLCGSAHFVECGNNIEEQRLADGAGFFGSVEHCDFLCGCRDGFAKFSSTERSVQTNLDKTDLFTFCG